MRLPARGLLAAGAAACAVLILLIAATGLLLAREYVPTVSGAHQSANGLRGVLAYLRGFQYWGGNVALLVAGLTVFGMLWYGWWKHARAVWLLTLGLFVATFIAQVSGKPLPLSRHDARTMVVEAKTAGLTPVLGSVLQDRLLTRDRVDDQALRNWYAAHRVFGGLIATVLALGVLVALYRSGLRMSAMATSAPVVVGLVVAFLGAPPGDAAQPADLQGGAVSPMWYVIPLHALLRWSQSISPGLGWVGVSAVPLVMVALLFALPWLSRYRWSLAAARSVALVGCLAVVAAYAQFGGTMQSPLTRAVHEMPAGSTEAPEEGVNRALVERGARVFDRENCRSCHALDGEGARGPGPALDGVGKRRPHRRQLIEFLRDPSSQGATLMPSYDSLAEEELAALAEFLRAQTG